MDVVQEPPVNRNIVNGLLIIKNRRTGDRLGLFLYTDGNGVPTYVRAIVVRGDSGKYGKISANVYFVDDCIATSDINGGAGTAFGSVLMFVMCIIGRARGMGRFEVGNMILTKGWEHYVDRRLLSCHENSDYRGEIEAFQDHCAEHATAAGWDLTPLLNLIPYIEVISQPEPARRKPTSRRCTIM